MSGRKKKTRELYLLLFHFFFVCFYCFCSVLLEILFAALLQISLFQACAKMPSVLNTDWET